MAQTPATFTATMPATFATFPATLVATLAARYATPGSPGQHGGAHTTSHRDRATEKGPATDKATGAQGRQAGSTPQKQQDTAQRTTPRHRAINKARRTRGTAAVYIGIAQSIKTPYRCVKMANKAYSRKAPGIHREKKETPHSVSHAGRWLFGKLRQVVQDKNRGK